MNRWIFLRGWARESRHWGDFVADFHAFHPEAEVVALDLPGAGSRCDEAAPDTVAGLVEACRAHTDRDAGPVNLLGLSLGGMVCSEWATRYPEEVERVVVVNASMRPFSRFARRLRPRNYLALARTLASKDARAREASVLRLTSRDPESHPDLVARWAGFALERPMTRGNALRQLWAAARFRASRRAPAAPLLVLCSEGDGLVDSRCSRDLARAWSAPIAIHPTAGHDLTLDDGPWVAAQVRRWIAASGPRAQS